MALTKVTYVDNVTVIGASNLNAIQDEIIANGTAVANLSSGKVDKINGKGLSTNDFSDELALKLSNIEAGATHVEVDDELSENSTNAVQNKVVAEKIREIEGNDPYASFEEKTVSGAVANFPDGAKDIPVKSLVVNVDPVQDLHGQENPYPAGGGKNKFVCDAFSFTNESVAYAYDPETNTLTKSGTSSGSGGYNAATITVPEGTYTFSAKFTAETGNATAIYLRDTTTNENVGSISINSGYLTVSLNGSYYVRLSTGVGETGGSISEIQLESGSSVTSYAPPSNLCPITGWTGANVVVTGVNLWDEQWEVGNISPQTGGNADATNMIRSKNYIKVLGNTTYYADTNNEGIILHYYDESKTHLGNVTLNNGKAFTTPVGCGYMRFRMSSNYGTTYNNDISINYPSTDTTYHAYNPDSKTIPITFPDAAGTVYGGTLTNQGTDEWKLSVNKRMQDGGDVSWNKVTNSEYRNFYFNVPSDKSIEYIINKPTVISSIYKSESNNSALASADNYVWVRTATEITVKDTSKANLTEAEFQTAMSGVIFVYNLKTPIEYTLTGEVVETLLGVNNIWADTGDSTVTYRADPTISSKAKELVIKAIIAPVLTEMKADTALVANDFRIVGDTLYKITSNIASGGTLTVGTNCIATTIGEQLKALLNA